MKKSVIAILLVAVVGLLVVGCADLNGGGTTGGSGGSTQKEETLVLTFSTVLTDTQKQAVENVLREQFPSAQTSIKAKSALNGQSFSIQASSNAAVKFGEWSEVNNKSVFTMIKSTIAKIGVNFESIKTFVENNDFTTKLTEKDNSIQKPSVAEETIDTGIDLQNAYMRTYKDSYYAQWIVDGSTYTQKYFRENVKSSESVYTFEVVAGFTGNIFVRYWDKVTNNYKNTTTPLNTASYSVYKATRTKYGSLDNDGNWNEQDYTNSHVSTAYFLVKQDATTLQIADLSILQNSNDYYIWEGRDGTSTLDTIMKVWNTYTGSNGTYSSRKTHTEAISITENTLTWHIATNGTKAGEIEMSLETISTSPTVYGFYNNQTGTTPVNTTGYTQYRITYTKYFVLNEQGVWEDYLSPIPIEDRSGYYIYKIDGNNLYLEPIIVNNIEDNDKYYIYTDDINNPVLDPDVYTK